MDKTNIWKPICKLFFIPEPVLVGIKSFCKYKKHIMLKDTMGRTSMFFLLIFCLQTISLGSSSQDWNNSGFKQRLTRTPEESRYRLLLPSRCQLIWILNIFNWKVCRTPETVNGNNWLSLFLPDEYKRSFRFVIIIFIKFSSYNSENRGHPLSRWGSSKCAW